ncbi:MAG TPA: hypothetical protein VKB46_04745 [Pyrinomonadaceae bacterium]|nr:hypothetical protein [Pyrinomonadaceae bacterium]
MKRVTKFLLGLLIVIVLSQLPFVYRRFRLGRLEAAIQQLNSKRRIVDGSSNFADYKGVVHVHSFLGGHSNGTFADIITAAQANGLQFVIMTEHAEKDFDTSAMTLKGLHGGVLFVNGNEVSTVNGDRLLALPGNASLGGVSHTSTDEVGKQIESSGAFAVVAYPEEFKSWDSPSFTGVEVFNVYSATRHVNPVLAFFDFTWSHSRYPALMFANYYRRPSASLSRWDEALTRRRLTATAGNDAHANVGLSLNDSTGKTLLGVKVDPYEVSFQLVRLHVLLPPGTALDEAALFQALKLGHCFVGFDLFGDSTGFTFTAKSEEGQRTQGDEVSLRPGTTLQATTPVPSRIVVFRNGHSIADEAGIDVKTMAVSEPGVYRVEVYLPQLGKPVGEQPWIISNPIYIR